MTNHGEFNWHELQTRDPQRAMTFYANTIGWTFQPEKMPSGDIYWIAMASDKPVTGILNMENASEDSGIRNCAFAKKSSERGGISLVSMSSSCIASTLAQSGFEELFIALGI